MCSPDSIAVRDTSITSTRRAHAQHPLELICDCLSLSITDSHTSYVCVSCVIPSCIVLLRATEVLKLGLGRINKRTAILTSMQRSSSLWTYVLLLLGVMIQSQAFLPPAASAASLRRPSSSKTPGTAIASGSRSDVKVFSTTDVKPETDTSISQRVITLTDAAVAHIRELREKQGGKHLFLRMGVRSGGCSGMSYLMDVVKPEDVTDEDHIEAYNGFSCVVDPKSLLYLFGLRLDYSTELIGGGFSFQNPNSSETCGCGKSFGI